MEKKYKDHIERNKDYIRVKFRGKITTMHRAIWELVNGEIPKDYMIHHKNGNKKDNRIDNLECLSRKQHGIKHRKKSYSESRIT